MKNALEEYALQETYRKAIEVSKASRATAERLRQELWAAEKQASEAAIAEERALVAYADSCGIPGRHLLLFYGSQEIVGSQSPTPPIKSDEQQVDELLASVPTAVSGESQ